MNDNPVYIVGLDRSGKTPLRLALSAHPHLALTRRTYMWTRFFQRYGDLAIKENFERCLSALAQQKTIQQFSVDITRIRQEFYKGEPSYPYLFSLFHRQFAEKLGKKRWGEQAGLGEHFAPMIIEAFPAARIIHMVRDPRNRCEEIFRSTPPTFRMGKMGALTASWLYSVRIAHQNQTLHPEQYKVVKYETLLTSPEKTLIEICDFIGEAFTPEMLTFENSITFGEPEKMKLDPEWLWKQDTIIFDHIQQSSLTPGEVMFIQAYANHEMTRLGYKTSQLDIPIKQRFSLFLEWSMSLFRMATWRFLEARLVS